MFKNSKISIVFPIYNEEKSRAFIRRVGQFFKNKEITYEFVIAEDGSTDGTKDKIKELKNKYKINDQSILRRSGYGPAVIRGIINSNYDYFLCCDSDGQIAPDSLNIINELPGDKFLIGYRQPRKDPLIRKIYSFCFKILHKIVFFLNLKILAPFVIGKTVEFKNYLNQLLYMKEGFWWGFLPSV